MWDYLTPFQVCYEASKAYQVPEVPFVEPGMYADAWITVSEHEVPPLTMFDLVDFWQSNMDLEGRN